MKTTHLPGRGLVAAVISSIGVRHDGAHDLVTDGPCLDLRYAPCATRPTTPRCASAPAWTATSAPAF
ncbi:hypothetical protein [Streptomyces sp. NPDC001744]|uniref:hypothetical protein n=1 Tax=Streptomyces sp. NPDC001744 TaxID=3364606 RepID=UPI00367DB3C2